MKKETLVETVGALFFLVGLVVAARAGEGTPATAVFSDSGEPAEEQPMLLNDGEKLLPEAAVPGVKVVGKSLGEFSYSGDQDYAYEFEYEPSEGKVYPKGAGKKLEMVAKWKGKGHSLKDAKIVIKKKKDHAAMLEAVCVKVKKHSARRWLESGRNKACLIMEFCTPGQGGSKDQGGVKKGKVALWSDGSNKALTPEEDVCEP